MSWTDCFPVFGDDLITAFEEQASTEEREVLDSWFKVDRVENRQASAKHVVSTSLFWKPDYLEQRPQTPSRESMMNAAELGLMTRCHPWEDYVEPVLEGARLLRATRPDVALRVYLANDLDFLTEELVDAGCEVFVMATSSLRHNPGAMWRFLAMESVDEVTTVVDADKLKTVLSDIARTEAARDAGAGGWRVPYNFGSGQAAHECEGYRPMIASQFGVVGTQPVTLLMKAFIWCSIKNLMGTQCQIGGRPVPIAGTKWPEYGFDEWFLMAAVYPRVAFHGLWTFHPYDTPPFSQFFALDIEYVTWANPSSELVYYDLLPGEDGYKPWGGWKDDARIKVRAQTSVVRRARKRIGAFQGIFNYTLRDGTEGFSKFAGDLPSFLADASGNMTEPWFVDFDPQLDLSSNGGEFFLDRRYENSDVVFCGYYFIKLSSAIADWARRNKLDEKLWGEGKLLKVPKLEGPMTLWKTEFSRKFHEALVSQVPFMKAEILLRAWMDQGTVAFAEATAKQMGWGVR